MVHGGRLSTATRLAETKGFFSSLERAAWSAHTFRITSPAKIRPLSEQELRCALRVSSTVQVVSNIMIDQYPNSWKSNFYGSVIEKEEPYAISHKDIQDITEGKAEPWSSWSDCEGNCSQSLQAFRSSQRISGERSRNRSHTINYDSIIEIQRQPCTPDCTSGWDHFTFFITLVEFFQG